MSVSRAYQVTALAHALISAAHTAKANEFMRDPQFKGLPRLVGAYARAGWFQGSVFFFIAALLNYRWARMPGPLTDPIERAIAALTTAIYWGSAAWYSNEGDKATAGVLTVTGGLQTWAAFFSKA